MKAEASQRATASTEIHIPIRTGLGCMAPVPACVRDKLGWLLVIKMKAAGCKRDETLGLTRLIHIFPCSIKGDAIGNPTLFISSQFPLESLALLERDLNSCSCLIYIHTAKAGVLTQGCWSRFSTVTAGSSCSAQGKKCAVFREAAYAAENMGFSLYFYCSNPLCPVTWFLIHKQ